MQSPLQVPKGAGEASMLKEIGETPSVLRRLIDEYVDATGTVKIPCLDAALPEGCCGGKTPSDVFLESRTGNFQNKCMIIGGGHTKLGTSLGGDASIALCANRRVLLIYDGQSKNTCSIL
mmetsp:Transcript_12726/g.18494  ORF Transcript_12726/g.18494 Transcript_12726/m.18494 type:complete len:120 (+) Transcript_12726:103-462(+)